MGVARVLQLIGFLGTFLTGTPHIEWDNLWFPVGFRLNQGYRVPTTMDTQKWPWIPPLGGGSFSETLNGHPEG